MNAPMFEVGLVSTDRALADFYAHVFGFDQLPPMDAGPGTLYRLQAGAGVLKVMVPHQTPAASEPVRPFIAATGLRYLTLGTDDLNGVIARSDTFGGRVQHGPMEFGSDVRIVVLEDPDGNAIEVVQTPS